LDLIQETVQDIVLKEPNQQNFFHSRQLGQGRNVVVDHGRSGDREELFDTICFCFVFVLFFRFDVVMASY
jgi:hypothetical protein